MADGTQARIRLLDNGKLDLAEPWVNLRLPSGQELLAPTEAFTYREDRYYLPLSLVELGLELSTTPETTVIPLISEELEVSRRTVPTTQVTVTTRSEHNQAVIDELLLKETVEVERVAVGREVGGPQPVRYEDDLIIIPVVEEVLVVQKRYVLKEEVRVRRRSSEVATRQQVTLRRQTAEVTRLALPYDSGDMAPPENA